jgi:hypothetical protein
MKSGFRAAMAGVNDDPPVTQLTCRFEVELVRWKRWHGSCCKAPRHGEFGLKEVPPHHFSSFAVLQY